MCADRPLLPARAGRARPARRRGVHRSCLHGPCRTTSLPRGGPNLDEVAYDAQARALADGHLTLPAATHDPFFRPFLSGFRDDRVVFKYQPVWPALIATSRGALGSTLPLRALLAAAGVVATYAFAWQLLDRRRVAIIAAVVVAVSPFTWIQSATLLGYQLSFVLGLAAAAAIVRAGVRPNGHGRGRRGSCSSASRRSIGRSTRCSRRCRCSRMPRSNCAAAAGSDGKPRWESPARCRPRCCSRRSTRS